MGAAPGAPLPVDERLPGQTVQDTQRTRAFAASHVADLSWADTNRMTRLHRCDVFPTMTLLATADHLTVMCSRPGPDPDCAELVMFLTTRRPPGVPRTTPTHVRPAADDAEPGIVLTQQIRVLAKVQHGMHQPGCTHPVLSSEERRAIDLHRNLDRYLGLPEPEQTRGETTK